MNAVIASQIPLRACVCLVFRAPLTDEQITLLVETLEKDSDVISITTIPPPAPQSPHCVCVWFLSVAYIQTLCYDVLLDSFVVVDSEAPQQQQKQQQGGQSPTATPGKHPKVNVEPDTDVVMADVA